MSMSETKAEKVTYAWVLCVHMALVSPLQLLLVENVQDSTDGTTPASTTAIRPRNKGIGSSFPGHATLPMASFAQLALGKP